MIKKSLVISNGQLEQLQAGDNLASIPIILELINGEEYSFLPGGPAYISSANTAKYANADDISSKNIIAFAVAETLAAETGVFQLNGQLTLPTADWDAITGETGGLTPGAIYFLDDVDVARITKTAPTTIGSYVVKVGIAISTTDFEIIIGTPIKL